MTSIHVLTPIDQASQLKRSPCPRGKQRAKRALEVIPHYATHAGAPTLAQAQAAAAGCFARLLVAWVTEHGQGVQHG